ncbi:uncharacterized protein LOC133903066 isoform X2 [Phragmites australis]|uniref:uncharacterized protein LOC133903066 isoform X2 n=1 Tax=Phragmites australis TaxID=29695 RepID=UPI002D7A0EFF|nr:uncharacterized protein LOC133903066 isoform X2 [Phragmites australis]
MAMTPPAAASLLHRALLPGDAAAPSSRLAPRARASVSVALLPRRRRCRGPLQLQSLPPEGAPAELMDEGSKFVPLNAEERMYGPPALLLIGFEKGETYKIQAFLKDLEGEFLKASSASAVIDI